MGGLCILTSCVLRTLPMELPTTSPQTCPLHALFTSLDPLSVTQNLAFHELYPDSAEGNQALARALGLLEGGEPSPNAAVLPPAQCDLSAIVHFVTRPGAGPPPTFDDAQLAFINKVSAQLCHHKLEGHRANTLEDLASLAPEEIDLGRGLLIAQEDQDVCTYEAMLDLMALQIKARLGPSSTPETKIQEINRLIFHEMNVRFPPQDLYEKQIDEYTFLSSVLDRKQGVCLGVSILYLALAQRLDLPLQILTPPGHIFLRYAGSGGTLNIETTARGVDLPDEVYLGVNTRRLQGRTLKEVIGLALINHASVKWEQEDYTASTTLLEKAARFLPQDVQLDLLLGLNYLFVGREREGRELLSKIRKQTPEYCVSAESIPDDYLSGKISVEGLKLLYRPLEDTRAAIVDKQQKLTQLLQTHPHFRAGLMQLATSWMRLGRSQEALDALLQYHALDETDAIVEYYLATLSLQRFEPNTAWTFLHKARALTEARGHHPKALKQLQHKLRQACPEPPDPFLQK